MKMYSKVDINVEISLNNEEAEILEHLCSYDLSEWFTTKCSKKYNKTQIMSTLDNLKTISRKILSAHEAANETIIQKLK